jgi:hypothetical protein
MHVEPLAHVGLAGRQFQRQLRVVDVVAVPGVAVDGVEPLVHVVLEGDAHPALLRAAPEKIVLAVVEHVEERPRDRFEQSGLARAVRPDNRGRPALEPEVGALVRLDVFQLDPCDVHVAILDFGF